MLNTKFSKLKKGDIFMVVTGKRDGIEPFQLMEFIHSEPMSRNDISYLFMVQYGVGDFDPCNLIQFFTENKIANKVPCMELNISVNAGDNWEFTDMDISEVGDDS